jgi:hypothetical protein
MSCDFVRHRRAAAALTVLAAGCLVPVGAAAAFAAYHRAAAHTARSLNGAATAHLHLVKPDGAQLYEEGPVTGALPGTMRATVDTGALFTGTFTIYTHNGQITGRGRATSHGSGRYESFSGTITITGGSARYAHAHGQAGLYGTLDRRTYAIVIQTTGRFSY